MPARRSAVMSLPGFSGPPIPSLFACATRKKPPSRPRCVSDPPLPENYGAIPHPLSCAHHLLLPYPKNPPRRWALFFPPKGGYLIGNLTSSPPLFLFSHPVRPLSFPPRFHFFIEEDVPFRLQQETPPAFKTGFTTSVDWFTSAPSRFAAKNPLPPIEARYFTRLTSRVPPPNSFLFVLTPSPPLG